MKLAITQAVVESDLEKSVTSLKEIGIDATQDIAAASILSALERLKGMMDERDFKTRYEEDRIQAEQFIPSAASTVSRAYVSGAINLKAAKGLLNEASVLYRQKFNDIGISLLKWT